MSAERALTRVRAPDEVGAEERAWAVVHTAYLHRVPSPRQRSRRRASLALALAALIGVLALSPAGATVRRLLTRAIGVEHAARALASLPAPGRLLVSGPGGTWTVAASGLTRRLGPWRQAAWSPHGMYVVVARGDRLTAVDPHGTPRWTLVRPSVSDPRWYSPSGFRIAYLSGDDLRVLAGDGTGDHLLAAAVAKVAPAWRADHPYELAYVTKRGALVVRDSDSGQMFWSTAAGVDAHQLAWSADGQRLLALSGPTVRIYNAEGRAISTIRLPRATPAIDGALSPDGRELALVLGTGEVVISSYASPTPVLARVLEGNGLQQVSWSPDGRWLLVSWPAANQWVFVRVAGAPRIAAVSRIAQQLSAPGARQAFPQLDGWCCTARGSAG